MADASDKELGDSAVNSRLSATVPIAESNEMSANASSTFLLMFIFLLLLTHGLSTTIYMQTINTRLCY